MNDTLNNILTYWRAEMAKLKALREWAKEREEACLKAYFAGHCTHERYMSWVNKRSSFGELYYTIFDEVIAFMEDHGIEGSVTGEPTVIL